MTNIANAKMTEHLNGECAPDEIFRKAMSHVTLLLRVAQASRADTKEETCAAVVDHARTQRAKPARMCEMWNANSS